MELPKGVDPAKITTVVVTENGTERHVPTDVFQKDGKWYARVNSLTNSVYAFIYSESEFADAKGKWYEAVANEIASRQIINGRSSGAFDGDAPVIRAELAAIIVRALGLPENGVSSFTDVPSGAWCAGAVGKAYEYGIVGGRSSELFDPMANITRQEAMAMIHRASAITELTGTMSSLDAFSDAGSIGTWALDAAKWNVGTGLIKGNSAGEICGQDHITRGETATVILRLLQYAGLVDIRSQT